MDELEDATVNVCIDNNGSILIAIKRIQPSRTSVRYIPNVA